MRDADYVTADLTTTATAIADRVCPICEEYLSNGEPVEPDLPYHTECLASAL